LTERLLKINDLEFDLDTGILLINLLEEISGKKIPGFNKQPKMRIQKVENNNKAVNFIASEGLKLVGIGAEDIVDHKLKLILGLIWTLILRYQIQQAGSFLSR
jgi:filamin